MSTNEYRMVWGNYLINKHGCIPRCCINEDLNNVNSTIGEHVIEVYTPNTKAQWLGALTKPDTKPIWSRYDTVYTIDEIKESIGLPEESNIFIFQK